MTMNLGPYEKRFKAFVRQGLATGVVNSKGEIYNYPRDKDDIHLTGGPITNFFHPMILNADTTIEKSLGEKAYQVNTGVTVLPKNSSSKPEPKNIGLIKQKITPEEMTNIAKTFKMNKSNVNKEVKISSVKGVGGQMAALPEDFINGKGKTGFYDYETIGSFEEGNLTPTQFSIVDENGNVFESFIKFSSTGVTSSGHDLLLRAINKANNNQKLTPTEKNALIWASDIGEMQNDDGTWRAIATHHEYSKNVNINSNNDILARATTAYKILTGTNGKKYTNVNDVKTIGKEMNKFDFLVGQNNLNYDALASELMGLKIKATEIDMLKVVRALYSLGQDKIPNFKLETLLKHFGVSSEEVKKKINTINGKGKTELDLNKLNEHLSTFDVAGTAKVWNEHVANDYKKIKGPNEQLIVKQGQIGIANRGVYRHRENDFITDSTGKVVKAGQGEYDDLMFSNGGAYEFMGQTQDKSGKITASFKDAVYGRTSYVTFNSPYEFETFMVDTFGAKGFMDKKAFKGSALEQQLVNQKIFTGENAYSNLRTQYKLLLEERTGIKTKATEMQRHRYNLLKSKGGLLATKGQQDIFTYVFESIDEALKNSKMTPQQKSAFVSMAISELGGINKQEMTANGLYRNSIESQIKSSVKGKTVGDYKTAYYNFLDQYKDDIPKESYRSLKAFIKNFEVSNDEIKEGNPFAVLNNELIKYLPTKVVNGEYIPPNFLKKGESIAAAKKRIETQFQGLKDNFLTSLKSITDPKEAIKTLLENKNLGETFRKAITGEHLLDKKRETAFKGKTGIKRGTRAGAYGVMANSFGDKLQRIISQFQAQGIGVNLVPAADGKSMTLQAFRMEDAGKVKIRQGNKMVTNDNVVASFTLPMVDAEGNLALNGQKVVNSWRPILTYNTVNGATVENVQMVTAQEEIAQKVYDLVKTGSNGEPSKLAQRILDGDLSGAQSLLGKIIREIYTGNATNATYKQYEETMSQVEAGGSPAAKAVRKTLIHSANFLTKIYNRTYKNKNNNEWLTPSNEQIGNMLNWAIYSSMNNKKLLGEFAKNDAYNFIAENPQLKAYLEMLGKAMGPITFGPVKEEAFQQGVLYTDEAKRLIYGTDLNSESARNVYQAFNTLPRTLRALQAAKEAGLQSTVIKSKGVLAKELENDPDKESRDLRYNIQMTDDKTMMNNIDAAIEALKSGSVNFKHFSNEALLSQLEQAKKIMPTVTDGGFIYAKSLQPTFESKIGKTMRIDEGSQFSKEFLEQMGITQEDIDSLSEGDFLDFGKRFSPIAEKLRVSFQRHGKKMTKENFLDSGSIVHGLKKENGRLVLNYEEIAKNIDYVKTLTSGGSRDMSQPLEDFIIRILRGDNIKDLTEMDNFNIDASKEVAGLKEGSSDSMKYFTQNVVGRFEYLVNFGRQHGLSLKDINQIISGSSINGIDGFFKHYVKYDENEDKFYMGLSEQVDKEGNISFVDENGNNVSALLKKIVNTAAPGNNGLFPSTRDGSLVSPITLELEQIASSIEQAASSKTGRKVKIGDNIISQGIQLANDAHYYEGVGFTSQGRINSDSKVKVGARELDSMIASISLAENMLGRDFTALKGVFEHGVQGNVYKNKNGEINSRPSGKKQALYKAFKSAEQAMKDTSDLANLGLEEWKAKNKLGENDVLTVSLDPNVNFGDEAFVNDNNRIHISDPRLKLTSTSGKGEGGGIDPRLLDEEGFRKLQKLANGRRIILDAGEGHEFSFGDGYSADDIEKFMSSRYVSLPTWYDLPKVNGKVVVPDEWKAFSQLASGLANGELMDEEYSNVLNTSMNRLFNGIFNQYWHKDSEIYKELHSGRVGNAATGKFRGMNVTNFIDLLNDQKFAKKVDRKILANSIMGSRARIASLLAVDPNAKRKDIETGTLALERIFANLYGDEVKNEIKGDSWYKDASEAELIERSQGLTNKILNAIDITHEDFKGKGLDGAFIRQPVTYRQGEQFVSVFVNDALESGEDFQVSPAVAKMLNGDFDGDTGSLWIPLAREAGLMSQEQYDGMVATFKDMRKIQDYQKDYMARWIEEEQKKAIAEGRTPEGEVKKGEDNLTSYIINPTGNFYVGGLSKENKGYTGKFSNFSEAVKVVNADLGFSISSENKQFSPVQAILGTAAEVFFEMLEQDSISAKKAGEKAVHNSEDFNLAEEQKKLGNLWQAIQFGKDSEMGYYSDDTAILDKAFEISKDLGIIAEDENGVNYIKSRPAAMFNSFVYSLRETLKDRQAEAKKLSKSTDAFNREQGEKRLQKLDEQFGDFESTLQELGLGEIGTLDSIKDPRVRVSVIRKAMEKLSKAAMGRKGAFSKQSYFSSVRDAQKRLERGKKGSTDENIGSKIQQVAATRSTLSKKYIGTPINNIYSNLSGPQIPVRYSQVEPSTVKTSDYEEGFLGNLQDDWFSDDIATAFEAQLITEENGKTVHDYYQIERDKDTGEITKKIKISDLAGDDKHMFTVTQLAEAIFGGDNIFAPGQKVLDDLTSGKRTIDSLTADEKREAAFATKLSESGTILHEAMELINKEGLAGRTINSFDDLSDESKAILQGKVESLQNTLKMLGQNPDYFTMDKLALSSNSLMSTRRARGQEGWKMAETAMGLKFKGSKATGNKDIYLLGTMDELEFLDEMGNFAVQINDFKLQNQINVMKDVFQLNMLRKMAATSVRQGVISPDMRKVIDAMAERYNMSPEEFQKQLPKLIEQGEMRIRNVKRKAGKDGVLSQEYKFGKTTDPQLNFMFSVGAYKLTHDKDKIPKAFNPDRFKIDEFAEAYNTLDKNYYVKYYADNTVERSYSDVLATAQLQDFAKDYDINDEHRAYNVNDMISLWNSIDNALGETNERNPYREKLAFFDKEGNVVGDSFYFGGKSSINLDSILEEMQRVDPKGEFIDTVLHSHNKGGILPSTDDIESMKRILKARGGATSKFQISDGKNIFTIDLSQMENMEQQFEFLDNLHKKIVDIFGTVAGSGKVTTELMEQKLAQGDYDPKEVAKLLSALGTESMPEGTINKNGTQIITSNNAKILVQALDDIVPKLTQKTHTQENFQLGNLDQTRRTIDENRAKKEQIKKVSEEMDKQIEDVETNAGELEGNIARLNKKKVDAEKITAKGVNKKDIDLLLNNMFVSGEDKEILKKIREKEKRSQRDNREIEKIFNNSYNNAQKYLSGEEFKEDQEALKSNKEQLEEVKKSKEDLDKKREDLKEQDKSIDQMIEKDTEALLGRMKERNELYESYGRMLKAQDSDDLLTGSNTTAEYETRVLQYAGSKKAAQRIKNQIKKNYGTMNSPLYNAAVKEFLFGQGTAEQIAAAGGNRNHFMSQAMFYSGGRGQSVTDYASNYGEKPQYQDFKYTAAKDKDGNVIKDRYGATQEQTEIKSHYIDEFGRAVTATRQFNFNSDIMEQLVRNAFLGDGKGNLLENVIRGELNAVQKEEWKRITGMAFENSGIGEDFRVQISGKNAQNLEESARTKLKESKDKLYKLQELDASYEDKAFAQKEIDKAQEELKSTQLKKASLDEESLANDKIRLATNTRHLPLLEQVISKRLERVNNAQKELDELETEAKGKEEESEEVKKYKEKKEELNKLQNKLNSSMKKAVDKQEEINNINYKIAHISEQRAKIMTGETGTPMTIEQRIENAELFKANSSLYSNILGSQNKIDAAQAQMGKGLNSVLNPWQDKMLNLSVAREQMAIFGANRQIETNNQRMLDNATDKTERETVQEQIKAQKELQEKAVETNKEFAKQTENLRQGTTASQRFVQSVKGMANSAIQYGIVYRAVQSLISGLYTCIGAIKEYDTVMTEIQMVTGYTRESTVDLMKGYKDVADQLGTTTSAIGQASITFLRQGRSIEDTNTLIYNSAVLAKTGMMEQTKAAELLTASLNGFDKKAEDSAAIVDLVSYTDQIAATSSEELMTAFQYVASSSNAAGIEIEKLNAMIATVSETTRLTASMIGQAFKTILSRLQQVKLGSLVDSETGEDISNVDTLMKQYGISIMDVNGKMKEGDEILSEFAEKWKSWGNDTAKKREAVEVLAGSRQGNIAFSLFDNWDRYQEIYQDTEENAPGSAAEKMETATESIESSLARLSNAWKTTGLMGQGFLKSLIDLGTGIGKYKLGILSLIGIYEVFGRKGKELIAINTLMRGSFNKLFSFIPKVRQNNLQKELSGNTVRIDTDGSGKYANVVDSSGALLQTGINSSTAYSMGMQIENNRTLDTLEKYGKINTDQKSALKNSQSQLVSIAARSNETDAAKLYAGNQAIMMGLGNGTINPENAQKYYAQLNKSQEEYLASNPNQSALEQNEAKIIETIDKLKTMGTEAQKTAESLEKLTTAITNTAKKIDPKNPTGQEGQEGQEGQKGTKQDGTKQDGQAGTKPTGKEGTKQDGTKQDGQAGTKQDDTVIVSSRTQKPNEPNEPKKPNNKNLDEIVDKIPSQTTDTSPTDQNNLSIQNKIVGKIKGTQGKLSKFFETNKGQAISGLTSMVGLMGGSMLGSTVAASLGADDATSSMIGMGTGMLTTAANMIPGYGPLISASLGLVGMVATYQKKQHEEQMKRIKEEREEIQKTLSETKQAFNNITTEDFTTRWKELSMGVDEYGNNISLNEEEYKEFREMVDTLTDVNPSAITYYDEEGKAMIKRNDILKDTIKILEETTKAEQARLYSDTQLKGYFEDTKKEREDLEKKRLNNYTGDHISQGIIDNYSGINLDEIPKELFDKYFVKNKDGVNVLKQDADVEAAILDLNNYIENDENQSREQKDKNKNNIAKTLRNAQSFYKANKEISKELKEIQDKEEQQFKQWAVYNATGYEDLTLTGQELVNTYIDNLNLTGEITDEIRQTTEDEIQDLINNLNNSDLGAELNQYKRLYASKTGTELVGLKTQIIQDMLKQFGEDKYGEGMDLLISQGIVSGVRDENGALKTYYDYKDKKNHYVVSGLENVYWDPKFNSNEHHGIAGFYDSENEIKELANYSSYAKEIEKRINERFGSDKFDKDVDVYDTLYNNYTEQQLEYILESFNKLTGEDITNLIEMNGEGWEKTFDKIMKNINKTIYDSIDLSKLDKQVKGIDSLFSAIQNYRENDGVMTPEVLTTLNEIRQTYNIDEERFNAALEKTDGTYSLSDQAVQNLINLIVEGAVKDGTFSKAQLEILDQNFKSYGINGAKESGYVTWLQNKMREGQVTIQNGSYVGNKTLEKKDRELLKEISNSDFMKGHSAELQNYYKTVNWDEFNTGYQDYIRQLSNGKATVTEFSNALEKATEKLGGLSSVYSIFTNGVNGNMFDEGTPVMEALNNITDTSSMKKAAKAIRDFSGDEKLNEFSDQDLVYLTKQGAENYLSTLKMQLAAIKSNPEAKNALKGMKQKELKEAQRSLADLKDNLKELESEKAVAQLQYKFNKVKVTIDKLNKSLETMQNQLKVLDTKDFGAIYNNQLAQLQTIQQSSNILKKTWDDFAKANYETGAETQAQAEILEEIGTNLKENALNFVEILNGLGSTAAESVSNNVTNVLNNLKKELGMLTLQQNTLKNESLTFYNSDAMMLSSSLFPTYTKDEFTKARTMSDKIVAEEKTRQDRITAVKQKALDQNFAEERKKREREIEKVKDDIDEIEKKIKTMNESLAADLESQIQNSINRIQDMLDAQHWKGIIDVEVKLSEFNSLSNDEKNKQIGNVLSKTKYGKALWEAYQQTPDKNGQVSYTSTDGKTTTKKDIKVIKSEILKQIQNNDSLSPSEKIAYSNTISPNNSPNNTGKSFIDTGMGFDVSKDIKMGQKKDNKAVSFETEHGHAYRVDQTNSLKNYGLVDKENNIMPGIVGSIYKGDKGDWDQGIISSAEIDKNGNVIITFQTNKKDENGNYYSYKRNLSENAGYIYTKKGGLALAQNANGHNLRGDTLIVGEAGKEELLITKDGREIPINQKLYVPRNQVADIFGGQEYAQMKAKGARAIKGAGMFQAAEGTVKSNLQELVEKRTEKFTLKKDKQEEIKNLKETKKEEKKIIKTHQETEIDNLTDYITEQEKLTDAYKEDEKKKNQKYRDAELKSIIDNNQLREKAALAHASLLLSILNDTGDEMYWSVSQAANSIKESFDIMLNGTGNSSNSNLPVSAGQSKVSLANSKAAKTNYGTTGCVKYVAARVAEITGRTYQDVWNSRYTTDGGANSYRSKKDGRVAIDAKGNWKKYLVTGAVLAMSNGSAINPKTGKPYGHVIVVEGYDPETDTLWYSQNGSGTKGKTVNLTKFMKTHNLTGIVPVTANAKGTVGSSSLAKSLIDNEELMLIRENNLPEVIKYKDGTMTIGDTPILESKSNIDTIIGEKDTQKLISSGTVKKYAEGFNEQGIKKIKATTPNNIEIEVDLDVNGKVQTPDLAAGTIVYPHPYGLGYEITGGNAGNYKAVPHENVWDETNTTGHVYTQKQAFRSNGEEFIIIVDEQGNVVGLDTEELRNAAKGSRFIPNQEFSGVQKIIKDFDENGKAILEDFVDVSGLENLFEEIDEWAKMPIAYSETYKEYTTKALKDKVELNTIVDKLVKNGSGTFTLGEEIYKHNQKSLNESYQFQASQSYSTIKKAQELSYNLVDTFNKTSENLKKIGIAMSTDDYNKFAEAMDNITSTIEEANNQINSSIEELTKNLQANLKILTATYDSSLIFYNRITQLNSNEIARTRENNYTKKSILNQQNLYSYKEQYTNSIQKQDTIHADAESQRDAMIIASNILGIPLDRADIDKIFNADGSFNEEQSAYVNSTTQHWITNALNIPKELFESQEYKTYMSNLDKANKLEKEGKENTQEHQNLENSLNSSLTTIMNKYGVDLQAAFKNSGLTEEQVKAVVNFVVAQNQIGEDKKQWISEDDNRENILTNIFNTISTLINDGRQYMANIVEKLVSIDDATLNNLNLQKELVDIKDNLLFSTDSAGKVSNLIDTLTLTGKSFATNREGVQNMISAREDIYNSWDADIVKRLGLNNNLWYDLSGNVIKRYFDEDQAKIEDMLQDKNTSEEDRQKLLAISNSLVELGTISAKQTEYVKSMGNDAQTIKSNIDSLVDLQKETLKAYTANLISQYGANTNNFDRLITHVDNIVNNLGEFNYAEKIVLKQSELMTYTSESKNLNAQLSTLTKENNNYLKEVSKISPYTSRNNYSSLLRKSYDATGEQVSGNYDKLLRQINEDFTKGLITAGQKADMEAFIEQYGENLKNISKTEDSIVKNLESQVKVQQEIIKLKEQEYKYAIDKETALLNIKKKEFELENKLTSYRKEAEKQLMSSKQSVQWLTKSERRKVFNEEDFNQLIEKLGKLQSQTEAYSADYYNQIMNLTNETLYQQEYITQEYETRMSMIEREYELTKKRVDLEKKQLELRNIYNEKNVRMYVNGEWKQVANSEDLRRVSEEYSDLESDYSQAQTEKIQQIYVNQMEKHIAKLKQSQSSLENTLNKTSSTQQEIAEVSNEFIIRLNKMGETVDIKSESLAESINTISNNISDFSQDIISLKDTYLKDVMGTISDRITNFSGMLSELNAVIGDYNRKAKNQNNSLEENNTNTVSNSKYSEQTLSDIAKIYYAKKAWEKYDKENNEEGKINAEALADEARARLSNGNRYEQELAWRLTKEDSVQNVYRVFNEIASEYSASSGSNFNFADKLDEFMNSLANTNLSLKKTTIDSNKLVKENNTKLNTIDANVLNTIIQLASLDNLTTEQKEEVKNIVTEIVGYKEQYMNGTTQAHDDATDAYNRLEAIVGGNDSIYSFLKDDTTGTLENSEALLKAIGNTVDVILTSIGNTNSNSSNISNSNNSSSENSSSGSQPSLPSISSGSTASGALSSNSNSGPKVGDTKTTITGVKIRYDGSTWTRAANGEKSWNGGPINIDEIGKELLVKPSSGRLVDLEYGTGIIPHNITENLMKWGVLNPEMLTNNANFESNLTNLDQSLKVNIDTIKLDNVTNGENFLPELNRFLRNTNTITLKK